MFAPMKHGRGPLILLSSVFGWPATGLAEAWQPGPAMNSGRAYPLLARGGDGALYAMGGNVAYPWTATATVERLDPAAGGGVDGGTHCRAIGNLKGERT